MGMLSRGEAEKIRQALITNMRKRLPLWELAAAFVSPNRIKLDSSRGNPGRKHQKILTNIAGKSLRTFQSGTMNGVSPRDRIWYNITSELVLTGSRTESVKRYLSESEKISNAYFQMSNLYRILPLAYKDVGTFSNSAFAQLPHPRFGTYFYPFAIGTYAYSCDAEGNTNTFARNYSLTVRQVVEQFGTYDPETGAPSIDHLPTSVKTMWKNCEYQNEIVLTNLIVPNPDYSPMRDQLNPLNKRFHSYTWVIGYNGDGGMGNQNPTGFRQENFGGNMRESEAPYIKVSGYSYFPVITPRWEQEAEGDYGVEGPTELALNDIMTVQEMEKYRLDAIEKMVRPPMVAPSVLRRHGSSILAGGITYLDEHTMNSSGGKGYRPAFEINPNLSHLIEDMNERKRDIEQFYYVDIFLMLNSERKVSHVTQREIDVRESERMSILSPMMGQWDQDLGSKIIKNQIMVLEDQGRMPERPRELMGVDLKAEYVSTIAQAVKASQMATVERAITFISSASQALQDPTMVKLLKTEKIGREYLDYSGLDPQLINNEQEYKKEATALAERMAQERALQAETMQAQNAKTMSETPVGNGSLLDSIGGR